MFSNDKALACDLIIITSPYSPKSIYEKIFAVATIDGFDQLDRRISLTIEMTASNIYMIEYNSATKNYDRVFEATNNFSGVASPTSQLDAAALFNSMFTP